VREPPGEFDLNFAGVYRISPDRGTLTLLANDFLTRRFKSEVQRCSIDDMAE